MFGPANSLLMYASDHIPEVKVKSLTRSADSFGINGRARAAEVSTKTADIAWNPQNQTADGYGPAMDSQMQMQMYQQLQEQMLRMQSAMEQGLCLYMEQKCTEIEKRLEKSSTKKYHLLTSLQKQMNEFEATMNQFKKRLERQDKTNLEVEQIFQRHKNMLNSR